MSAGLHIKTLGELSITLNGAPVTGLASRKAEALLVYLACRPGPHARAELGDLLWDGLSTERARGNLSVLLTSLRQQLGNYLIINRQTVAFNPAQPHTLDLAALPSHIKTTSAANVAALERGLALYQGDFLASFSILDGPRFEEWVLGEQCRVREQVNAARRTLIAHYLNTDTATATEAGIQHAKHLLTEEPLDEEIHCALMQLYARNGQRNAALAQYELCRTALHTELGIPPAEPTTALYQRIRGEATPLIPPKPPTLSPPTPPVPPILRNAPFEPTSWVGRESELAYIAARLNNPNCRLLTLVGPGGMGKTRLSLEATRRYIAAHHCDGVFVALASLNSAELVAGAIADALGIKLSGKGRPDDELLILLQERQLLILLDNAEHLPDAAPLVNAMLSRAPGLKVLVTSREPLFVQAEWLFDLHGLEYPGDDSQLIGALIGTQHLEQFSALRLFVERASRVQAGFALDETNAQAIICICQLVDGLPLGIELAAAWVHGVPCTSIATEIARNRDFLATRSRDVPQRHRSLRAVFDHSWNLLDPALQDHLRKIAVFHNRFDLDAAVAVCAPFDSAQSTARLHVVEALAALVDKSLLRINASGRYELHELVHQFAWEKLEADAPAAQAARQQHAHYYAQWMQQHETRLIGPQQNAAVRDIGAEIDNVRAAWLWAVDQQDYTVLAAMLHSLYLFLDIRNRFQDAYELFDRAIAKLQDAAAARAVLGQLLTRQGKLCERLGDYERGVQCVERGLAIAREVQVQPEIAYSLEGLARIVDRQTHYQKACRLLEESLAIYRALNDRWGIANVLHHLGSVAEGLQNYTEGRRFALESLAIRRALDDRRGMALSYNLLGLNAEMLQDYPAAVDAYLESLALFRELNDRWGMSLPLSNLGDVCNALKDYATAQTYYRDALRLALEIGNAPFALTYVVKIAILLAETGHGERAAALLSMALQHPATEQAFKDRAQHALTKLAAQLPARQMTAARAQGKGLALEAVGHELVNAVDLDDVRLSG